MEQKFLIYGQSINSTIGVVVALNFRSLHQQVCSGIWNIGDQDSDYEYWIPTNFEGDKCLFGRKMKYVRRKRTSKCFNSQEFDQKYFLDICPCTKEDWECDFGFIREHDDGDCIAISNNFKNKLEDRPPQNCRGTYEVKTGYKKVAGDYCNGGVDLGPKRVPCPTSQ